MRHQRPFRNASPQSRKKAAARTRWRKHACLLIALCGAANIARRAKKAVLLFFVGEQVGEAIHICAFVLAHQIIIDSAECREELVRALRVGIARIARQSLAAVLPLHQILHFFRENRLELVVRWGVRHRPRCLERVIEDCEKIPAAAALEILRALQIGLHSACFEAANGCDGLVVVGCDRCHISSFFDLLLSQAKGIPYFVRGILRIIG